MFEKPHPLAVALCALERFANADAARHLLLLGGGLGRNIPPLLHARFHVDVLDEDVTCVQAIERLFTGNTSVRAAHGAYTQPHIFGERYDAVLSTHALLHGQSARIAQTMDALRDAVRPGADLLFTLGSTRDPRCGVGRRIDARTWAATEGGEKDIPHVYYNEEELRTLLHAYTIVSLRETSAKDTVGSWAHARAETPDIVHWFVHAQSLAS